MKIKSLLVWSIIFLAAFSISAKSVFACATSADCDSGYVCNITYSGGTCVPGGGSGSGSSSGGWSLSSVSDFGLPAGSIGGIVNNLLMWLLMIFGFIGIIGFIISGIMYVMSAGDETAAGKAKNMMKWSIVGVVVGLAGVVIIQAVDFALRAYGGF